jgi:hypothetical protein
MSEGQIHITRQGTQYGPYPESSVKNMLAEGQLLPTDLAWYEGAESWQPLQELLGTKVVETPPPVPQDIKPEEQSDDGEQSGKIRVMRNGEAIGPYSWDKAREYFITGQLLPTDVACADAAGEDWKPLNEVLGLPAPIPMSTSSGAKSGKGKKIAMIAGISVLVIGLITAGILYGPKLLGGGKIGTPEELVERAVKALKNNDKEAMFKLTAFSFSKSDQQVFIDVLTQGVPDDSEIKKGIEDEFENVKSNRDELTSGMEDIIKSAEDDGVDWSDVTIGDVDADRLKEKLKDIPDPESKFFVGEIGVSITSKGKEFELRVACRYTPSLGWFVPMGNPLIWQGPKR